MVFSKLFGSKKEANTIRPPLEHARELRTGDMFEMGISAISELNSKTFEVIEANTLDYGEGLETSLVVKADSQKYGLYIVEDDEGESLQFSKLLRRKDVGLIFDIEIFGQVFDEGTGWTGDTQAISDALTDWIDPKGYVKTVDALKGYFQEGDHRLGKLDSRAEEYDYYELEGRDHNFSIEIEVYDAEETEVYACRLLPTYSIDKLWPKDE